MAETASDNLIDRRIDLGREAQELILEGVDRVKTALGVVTILRGKLANGENDAIVLGVDQPLELLLADDASESEGFLSKLRNNPVARLIGGVALAIGAAVGIGSVLGGCNTNSDSPSQPAEISGTYGTQTGALTLDQILNVGESTPVPWGAEAFTVPNYAEINGEKYLFFSGKEGVKYVKCQTIEDCLSADANIQTVQGLDAADLIDIFGIYTGTSGAYQDKDGNNKLLVESKYEDVYQCDIVLDVNAVLEAINCTVLDPSMKGGFSLFRKSGFKYGPFTVPFAIWGIKRRDLQTGKDTILSALNDDSTYGCGSGFEGDLAPLTYKQQGVVGTIKIQPNWWDEIKCYLAAAEDWQKLHDNPIFLNTLNADSNLSLSPRLADGYILFAQDYELRSAKLAPAPENPEPDTDAGDAGSPDAVIIDKPDAIDESDAIDEPDTIDEPEVYQPDATDQDAGPEPDAASQDTGPETDDSNQPNPDDIAEIDQPDAANEPTQETSTPDENEADTQPNPDDIAKEISEVIDATVEQENSSSDTAIDIYFEMGGTPDTDSGDSPDAGPTEVDISYSTPETVPVQDTSTPKPSISPQDPNNGGCNIIGNPGTTTKNPNSAGHLSTLALAMMALGATTRIKLASIFTRIRDRVARSLKNPGLHR